MVKVAIAGATSQLAREIIHELVTTQNHEILVLGRGDTSAYPVLPGVKWEQASGQDKTELVKLLTGVHTLVSFWAPTVAFETHKLLLDAAVEAGVKRFAPSEWSMSEELSQSVEYFPWYKSKLEMREYLRKINEKKKVIEYTLFQVGTFMEYIGFPRQTLKHVAVIPSVVNLESCRIIALEGHLDDPITFTSVEDIAAAVTGAIEYTGEWPVVGGISGDRISLRDVMKIGERITGVKFRVDLAREEDVKAGILNIDHLPPIAHHSIPKEHLETFKKEAICGVLLSMAHGGWTVTDDWNKLLPQLKFTSVEEFVQKLADTKQV